MVHDPAVSPTSDVLTPEAREFLTLLQREFGGQRDELLAARRERAQRLRDGELPGFLPETESIRAATGGYRRRRPT